jgi:hypothetical protein
MHAYAHSRAALCIETRTCQWYPRQYADEKSTLTLKAWNFHWPNCRNPPLSSIQREGLNSVQSGPHMLGSRAICQSLKGRKTKKKKKKYNFKPCNVIYTDRYKLGCRQDNMVLLSLAYLQRKQSPGCTRGPFGILSWSIANLAFYVQSVRVI